LGNIHQIEDGHIRDTKGKDNFHKISDCLFDSFSVDRLMGFRRILKVRYTR
jgi:hypothetical protein